MKIILNPAFRIRLLILKERKEGTPLKSFMGELLIHSGSKRALKALGIGFFATITNGEPYYSHLFPGNAIETCDNKH